MFKLKYFFLSAAATLATIGWAETDKLRFPFIIFMLIGVIAGAALYEDIRRNH